MSSTQELIEKYKLEMQKMALKSKTPNKKETEDSITMQNSEPNEKAEFPRFESSEESLVQRIEEILSQNNDVSREQDYEVIEKEGEVQAIADDTPDILIEQILNDYPHKEAVKEAIFLENENNNDESLNETPQEMVSRVCIRGGQKAQYSPPANTGSARGPEGATQPLTDTSFLRVEVFTANRAIPIANAMIRIKSADDNSLIAVLTTNESGVTEKIELAAPDRNLSLVSSDKKPFVTYLADISAEGFTPQLNLPIQMFGGVESLLPANLIIK